jgi:hypothetical protein
MSSILKRLIGILLIAGAIVGLLFSVGGLVAFWQYKSNLENALVAGVELVGEILGTTSQALVVTKDSVGSAVDSIGALQSTLETTARTMETTQPMLVEIERLMDETLPNTVRATQESLTTAQESAQVIDGVLTALSRIPLVGIPYNPDVPLHEALGGVVEEIEPLPESFANMAGSLTNTSDEVAVLQSDLEVMAQSIGSIQENVSQYEAVLESYLSSVQNIQNQLDAMVDNVPKLVNMMGWGLTIFLIWMAIAQIGLFTQGVEWLTGNPFGGRPVKDIETVETVKAEAKDEVEKPSDAQEPE